MLDDKDEFESEDWLNWHCPNCGGYREDGCSTCAHYSFLYNLLVKCGYYRENSRQAVHEEILRRMEEEAV